MNNKTLIILLVVVVSITAYFVVKGSNMPTDPTSAATIADNSEPLAPAEKLEVIHFHATQQCVSCVAVGRLAKRTIEEKFSQESECWKSCF
jgi:uncharacterized protein YpmB